VSVIVQSGGGGGHRRAAVKRPQTRHGWRGTLVADIKALLTVKQVAGRLAVSQSLVYDLASKRLLRHHRIAGRGRATFRFAEGHVQEYLDRTLRSATSLRLRPRHPPEPKVTGLNPVGDTNISASEIRVYGTCHWSSEGH
jgi:excisionase family DNA binding protein